MSRTVMQLSDIEYKNLLSDSKRMKIKNLIKKYDISYTCLYSYLYSTGWRVKKRRKRGFGKLSDEKKREVLRRYATEKSTELAKEFKVTRSSILNAARRAGVKKSDEFYKCRNESRNRKANRLENRSQRGAVHGQ